MWLLSGKSGYSINKATGQRQTVAINQPQGLRVRVSFGQALSWEPQIVALTDVENHLLQWRICLTLLCKLQMRIYLLGSGDTSLWC